LGPVHCGGDRPRVPNVGEGRGGGGGRLAGSSVTLERAERPEMSAAGPGLASGAVGHQEGGFMVNEAGRPREGTNGPAREHTRGRGVLKKRPVSPSATGWFEKRGLGLSKGDRIQDPPPGPRPRAPGLHENHLAVIGGGGGHQHEEQEKEEEEAARPGPGPPAPRHVGLPLGGEGEGGGRTPAPPRDGCRGVGGIYGRRTFGCCEPSPDSMALRKGNPMPPTPLPRRRRCRPGPPLLSAPKKTVVKFATIGGNIVANLAPAAPQFPSLFAFTIFPVHRTIAHHHNHHNHTMQKTRVCSHQPHVTDI